MAQSFSKIKTNFKLVLILTLFTHFILLEVKCRPILSLQIGNEQDHHSHKDQDTQGELSDELDDHNGTPINPIENIGLVLSDTEKRLKILDDNLDEQIKLSEHKFQNLEDNVRKSSLGKILASKNNPTHVSRKDVLKLKDGNKIIVDHQTGKLTKVSSKNKILEENLSEVDLDQIVGHTSREELEQIIPVSKHGKRHLHSVMVNSDNNITNVNLKRNKIKFKKFDRKVKHGQTLGKHIIDNSGDNLKVVFAKLKPSVKKALDSQTYQDVYQDTLAEVANPIGNIKGRIEPAQIYTGKILNSLDKVQDDVQQVIPRRISIGKNDKQDQINPEDLANINSASKSKQTPNKISKSKSDHTLTNEDHLVKSKVKLGQKFDHINKTPENKQKNRDISKGKIDQENSQDDLKQVHFKRQKKKQGKLSKINDQENDNHDQSSTNNKNSEIQNEQDKSKTNNENISSNLSVKTSKKIGKNWQ